MELSYEVKDEKLKEKALELIEAKEDLKYQIPQEIYNCVEIKALEPCKGLP